MVAQVIRGWCGRLPGSLEGSHSRLPEWVPMGVKLNYTKKDNERSKVFSAQYQLLKWFLVYLNILTQSVVITDSMFNFGNFLTKNAITFDQKEIERKKIYLASMKFCCASNAAIKNFFTKYFQQNRHF